MAASISIIIITYNRPEDTLDLLENLKHQKDLKEHAGEILLLNNASTVSYQIIEDFLKNNADLPIRYIDHDENLGVARGRNFLLKQARFPYSLVLDDDILFEKEDGLAQLPALFEQKHFKENNTAVVTLSIFYHETLQRQENALPHKRYKEYKDKSWFLTYYFAGGGHIIKNEVFEKIGYYPEDFFYGMEEYDLSYRIIHAGYSLGYDHSVKLLHKESPLGRTTTKEKFAMMWYNKSVVTWRYLPNFYFYTTSFMWFLQYLNKSKFDIGGGFKNLKKIFSMRKTMPTQKISKEALQYLKKVKARLWY